MKTYEITFTIPAWNGTYSANIVNAETVEQAAAYYTAQGYEVAGCEEYAGSIKPGQPVETVPEGWEPEEQDNSETRELSTVEQIRANIEARTDRSAWGRGVNGYALEILDVIEERSEYEGHEPETLEELRDYALNGAESSASSFLGIPGDTFQAWIRSSEGGSYEICDPDIARRLCTPSELKRTRDGKRNPNSRETWLEVQGRALYQAYRRIRSEFRDIKGV